MKSKRQVLHLLLVFISFLFLLSCEKKKKINSEMIFKDEEEKYVLKIEKYLQKIGKYNNYIQIKEMLEKEGLREFHAKTHSFWITLNGITPELVDYLRAKGLDVFRQERFMRLYRPEIWRDSLRFSDQASITELVIIGNIERVDCFPEPTEPSDGFYQSVTVKIEEVLVGEPPSDTIIYRQFTCKGMYSSDDVIFSPGERYLFFLSNGVYRYYSDVDGDGFAGVKPLIEYPESLRKLCYYRSFHVPHLLVDGELRYPKGPHTIKFDTSNAEDILKEIRMIGQLRKKFRISN